MGKKCKLTSDFEGCDHSRWEGLAGCTEGRAAGISGKVVLICCGQGYLLDGTQRADDNHDTRTHNTFNCTTDCANYVSTRAMGAMCLITSMVTIECVTPPSWWAHCEHITATLDLSHRALHNRRYHGHINRVLMDPGGGSILMSSIHQRRLHLLIMTLTFFGDRHHGYENR